MAAETEAPAPPAASEQGPNHGLRIFIPWLVLSVVADAAIWVVWGPHLPPGAMSSSAASQQFDIKVMAVMAAPVMLFVLIYFGYALIVWRHREGDDEDGPPLHGNTRIQATWITLTSVIVLSLFVFGTYELVTPQGAGAGEGASPIWKPGGAPLQVQVIAQQWRFTYRYPQYGGFETTDLVLPVGQFVEFHVTSVDVIHSFWAYQLGVKADANPGVDNVAYTKINNSGKITIRCAELCGLWHGAMFDYGTAMPASGFQTWANGAETHLAAVTKMLPPYALTYDPTVVAQMSKAMVAGGFTGGAGLYYPPTDPEQP
ncbi:MAG TPA: cytochrome c oxidase subunit II [Streptosporangiaceae bacterium]|jgi:cytochrome c oxidase subunit 2|nr:cytochrome c oxidase subunit II [Streptosporangiaceae bacterium]